MPFLRTAAAWVVAGLGLVAYFSPARAEQHWIEIDSPHFRVVTDGSAGDGRKVAAEFEQMRYVVHLRFPTLLLDPSAPITIFAARDDISAGLSGIWRSGGPNGHFVPAWDGSLAIVRLDRWSLGGRDAIYDDYVQNLIERNLRAVPRWLDTGVSTFLANSRFGDKQIVVGAPAGDWQTLASERFLPLSAMLGLSPPDGNVNSDRWQTFRGESWAMVHFMTFGPGMQNGNLLLEFLGRLEAGGDERAVFGEVFGAPAAFERSFRSYLQARSLPAGVLAPAAIDPDSFPERALTPAQALFEQGMFHLSLRDMARGRGMIERALALDPRLAEGHQELGFLNYEAGRNAEARTEWEEAMTLDPTLYRARFARAATGSSFREQTAEQRAFTLGELEQVIRLKPRYAPAYARMALLLWWQGDLEGAYRAAAAAVRLEPARNYDALLARVLIAQKKETPAAAMMRRSAAENSGPDRDEAVALWREVAPANRDPGLPLAFDLGPDRVVAEGTLTEVGCEKNGQTAELKFELRPSGTGGSAGTSGSAGAARGQELDFQVHFEVSGAPRVGFSDAIWIGGGHFSHFSLCFHAAGHPGIVTYVASAGGPRLVRIEVLEDAPDL